MNFKFFSTRTLAADIDSVLLLLRIICGVAMMFHGWGKIQAPMSWMGPDSQIPGIFLALAAVSEFGGGLALVLGLVTRLAVFGLACTMAVAAYMHAIVFGDPFVSNGGGSYELATIYLVISILFFVTGPGRFSLDFKIFGAR